PDLFSRVFPADMRPQAHEIIRTWLFSTIVRSELEHHQLPWRHAAISGWILDPDRKKMAKSKGNVVVPTEPLERHGTDAVRYWAAAARLGVDTAYDEQQMKVGRRLAIKILNVSRFVLTRLAEADAGNGSEPDSTGPSGHVTEAIDAAMLASLAAVVSDATAAFERYDHARALELTESFFWTYCDDYVELVKARAYGEATGSEPATSARLALELSLSVLLRCFAPFLPYCTEETWSWWHSGSIHRAPWPLTTELTDVAGANARPELLGLVGEVLASIRRTKSEAHRSVRAPVRSCVVTGPPAAIELLQEAGSDLEQAGTIGELGFLADDGATEVTVTIQLGDDPSTESAST
ncbi:MAG TPA: class I tRNA ligase family protein, partial [Acidimicrobiales bacterium]|nr:class I tRNA ligase family protein [Acidimicrobiales bacterium]